MQSKAEARRISPAVEILIVLLLTIVSAIRLYKLGAWSFWVDEMFTLRDATGGFHNMTYPLSYILIGEVLKAGGINEWNARIIPCLVGIITPATIYLLSRREFGRGPALAAAAIIAISPWHLYWSQMARFYTMTMLFSGVAALLFFSGLERNSRWRMGVAVVAMILAVLSHYSAFLVLAALMVYTALAYALKWPYSQAADTRPRTGPILTFFLPFALAGFAMTPKVLFILSGYSKSYATTGTTFANPVKGAVYVAFSTVYRVELAVAAAAILTTFFLLGRRDRRGLFLTTLILIPLTLVVIAGAMSRGENRYALVTLPAFALLAGMGMTIAYNALRPRSVVLAAIIPAAIALPLIQHCAIYFSPVSNGERWDYRSAAEIVRKHGQPGDIVLTPMYMPMDYYLKKSKMPVIDLESRDLRKYPKWQKRIWIVVEDSTRGLSAGTDAKKWLQRDCSLIANFPASSPVANYGVSVYLYLPNHSRESAVR